MTSSHVATLLIAYAGTACLFSLATTLFRRHASASWLPASAALIAGVAASSFASSGRNALVQLCVELWHLERTHSAAFAAGCSLGLLAGFALHHATTRPARAWFGAVHLAAVAALGLITLKDQLSTYLARPQDVGASGRLFAQAAPAGFKIEEIHRLSIAPTSIALGPDGLLYVAGFGGVAFQNGVVVRLERAGAELHETVVASSLNRPHGIAFHEGDLFISRAGQFSRAVNGAIVHQNTGCVTRARDLDGDGVYDHFTDILEDLPGAKPPDGLHQNNGIAFDAQGYLYVTVGVCSDHGPPVHPFEGTILRARPDGSDVGVFARGFRNPFDLAFGPDAALFCTDNDANAAGRGDELNHVMQGGHYGHPYSALADGATLDKEVLPLLRSDAALEGLAYAPPGSLPNGFDDCLYTASFGNGQIIRIRLKETNTSFQATTEQFARVPSVVDVAISAQEHAIYACSHDERKIYRISPQ
ncbi:MAG: PQQ-dependent sugar dehydrogenase [Planctomycetes bacterium]|nr:PQQ-dependent sugar dehydrogenase [Planctomycetota bacterium]